MSNNVSIDLDHKGKMHVAVDGVYAMGVEVAGMQNVNGEMVAVVWVPLKHASFGEVRNVVPFVRPAA